MPRPPIRVRLALGLAVLTAIGSRESLAQGQPARAPDPEPPPAPAARAIVARDGWPLAGRAGEYFYLRDPDDEFRLYLQGRAHIDGYWPLGPGVSDLGAGQGAKPTFFLRRARIELSGEFLHDWQWTIGGEFGQSSVDNASGQTSALQCSVDQATGAQTCTPRTSPVEAPGVRAAPTDLFVNYRVAPELNFEVGQLKVPFSLENRTSENITPFLESSMAVRNLGAPTTRDIGAMVWGETRSRLLYYTVGVFNGDGPNRSNQDANADGIGRVMVHPFVTAHVKELEALQLGVSARYGVRNAKTVGYDVNTFTTQGGFAFWRPTYTDSGGNFIHIIPSAAQRAVGAELYWPVSVVDLTSELVVMNNGTREARDGLALASPYTERYGTLRGFAYYAQIGVWLVGDRQYVRRPGYVDPVHIDFAKPLQPSRHSLEALARFEQLRVSYSGAARSGTDDEKTPNGQIRVDALTFGLNYWATRRVRVSLNYGLYSFPDSAPVSPSEKGGPTQSSSQRALAPAQLLPKGVDDAARDSAHVLHELSFRVGIGF